MREGGKEGGGRRERGWCDGGEERMERGHGEKGGTVEFEEHEGGREGGRREE